MLNGRNMPKAKQAYLYFYAVLCLMVNIMACISAAPAAVISSVTTQEADTCPLDVVCNVITCNCSVSSSWSWRILGQCYLAWRGKLTSKLSTSDPQVADIKLYQTFKLIVHNQQNAVRRVAYSPTDHQRSCLCLLWATFPHLSMYLFPN